MRKARKREPATRQKRVITNEEIPEAPEPQRAAPLDVGSPPQPTVPGGPASAPSAPRAANPARIEGWIRRVLAVNSR